MCVVNILNGGIIRGCVFIESARTLSKNEGYPSIYHQMLYSQNQAISSSSASPVPLGTSYYEQVQPLSDSEGFSVLRSLWYRPGPQMDSSIRRRRLFCCVKRSSSIVVKLMGWVMRVGTTINNEMHALILGLTSSLEQQKDHRHHPMMMSMLTAKKGNRKLSVYVGQRTATTEHIIKSFIYCSFRHQQLRNGILSRASDTEFKKIGTVGPDLGNGQWISLI